jgi:hypothetical protein
MFPGRRDPFVRTKVLTTDGNSGFGEAGGEEGPPGEIAGAVPEVRAVPGVLGDIA